PMGGGFPRFQNGSVRRNADLHRAGPGRIFLYLEKRRARLVGRGFFVWKAGRAEGAMTLPEGLEPFALSTQEKLGELTVEIAPDRLVEACQFLKYHSGFERLSTVTAIDRYPSELRFEVVYHVHSISRNVRLRLKCRLPG